MNSTQLLKAATKIPNFLGVFSPDNIPPMKLRKCPKPCHFITNNQTSNLPGQHWIGVTVNDNNSVYIWDPFGVPPPQLLICNLVRALGGRIAVSYNKQQVQKLGTSNCGPLVLEHLINKSKSLHIPTP